ncbi:MAG: hypothetical protein ACREEA_04675 [Stellaceae bacterium]
MRLLSILRVVTFAALLSAPLGHVALADSQQPPAAAPASASADTAGDVFTRSGGPYDNDFLMSPPVGN